MVYCFGVRPKMVAGPGLDWLGPGPGPSLLQQICSTNSSCEVTKRHIIDEDRRTAKALKLARSGIKRKADITYNLDDAPLKKPTRLGPILRERFGGASLSSSAA